MAVISPSLSPPKRVFLLAFLFFAPSQMFFFSTRLFLFSVSEIHIFEKTLITSVPGVSKPPVARHAKTPTR